MMLTTTVLSEAVSKLAQSLVNKTEHLRAKLSMSDAAAATESGLGTAGVYRKNLVIPVDLFFSKKRRGLTCAGEFRLTDHSGDLVFVVDGQSSKSTLPLNNRLLLDAASHVLISMSRHATNGSWEGFREHRTEEKELIFRVEERLNKFTITELEVFFVGENWGDSVPDYTMRGCRFWRSCTIYRGNTIVAQTSLMYTLGKVIVGRCRFRVTIFPGHVDYALIVALLVIFFDRRR